MPRGRPKKIKEQPKEEAVEVPEVSEVTEAGEAGEAGEEKKDMQKKTRIKDFGFVKVICKTTKALLSNAPAKDPIELARKLGMEAKATTFSEFPTDVVDGKNEKRFINDGQILGAMKASARSVGLTPSIGGYIRARNTITQPSGETTFMKFPLVRVMQGKKIGGGWRVHEALPRGSVFETELLIPFYLDGAIITEGRLKQWLEVTGSFFGIGANPKDFGKFEVTKITVKKLD